ncbi:MAG: hypothetical protein ACFFE2_00230 [Candidatus Thorarchaeota archaeon]
MSSRRMARIWPYTRFTVYQRELRKAAARWFSKKGYVTDTKMRYCLKSRNDWSLNIICKDVAEYIQRENEQSMGEKFFPLHKYLHHGLSSQALIFNLVGPLIVRKDLEPLRIAIERAGIDWPEGEITTEFEYDNKTIFNEDSGQPTSMDLVISGENGRIFVESKFTEQEFGDCSVFTGGDCDGRNPLVYGLDTCYLHHIGRKYWVLMSEFGFGDSGIASGFICPFTNYYQFFREVLFSLKEEGCFLLLYDERSPVFVKTSKNGIESGLWPFLLESVLSQHKRKIGRVTIQQVVQAISESGRHSDWLGEFKQKYGIDTHIQTKLK